MTPTTRALGLITLAVAVLLVLATALSGCGGDGGQEPSGPPADSTRTSSAPPSAGADRSESDGFFSSALDFLLSNPRLEGEEDGAFECGSETDHADRALTFHTLSVDDGNDFNTANEAFETSSPDAQTPYVTYATWDPCHLYLGLTGSAVGAGDCSGPDCPTIDAGESPYRYWKVYIDTDPEGTAGTQWPRSLGPTPERLPLRADYLVEVRLDGTTTRTGDEYAYQGNAQLYSRTSDWRIGLEESWQPQGRQALEIGDDSTSNFLKLALDREAIGDPCAVQMVGWVVDTQADTTFAYWPPPRGYQRPPVATVARAGSGRTASATLDGRRGSASGPSQGRPPSRTDSASRSRRDSTWRMGQDSTWQPVADRGSVRPRSSRPTARPTLPDSLVLDVYGFMLTSGQQPNASGNLNRTDYSLVAEGCTKPTRPRE